LANQGLLDVLPGGGFVVKEFTLADIWDAIEMRGVLEGTAAPLAAERLTNDRELDPLRRSRDELEAMLVPTIDSFACYLDLNQAFHTALVALAQEFHAAADDGTGSGTPVCFPERFGVCQLQAPQGRRGDRRGA
jgi:GntR family transcriptional regulator of vanillate catabolism